MHFLFPCSTFACASDGTGSEKDLTLAKLFQAPHDLMTQGYLYDARFKCKEEGLYNITILFVVYIFYLAMSKVINAFVVLSLGDIEYDLILQVILCGIIESDMLSFDIIG